MSKKITSLEINGNVFETNSLKQYVDSNFVNLSSSQNIDGLKTFSTLPQSSVSPSSDNQLTNKSYVDTTISAKPF